MLDTKALAATLLQTVRDWVEPAFKTIDARVRTLEQRAPVPGPKGDPGERGLDGNDGAVGRDGVDGKDGAAGKDGRDGIDGKDGAPGNDGRDGIDGKNGERGEQGPPGEPGKSFTLEEVQALVDEAVKQAVSKLPVPKDGRDGEPGEKGDPGERGVDGKDGRDGKDGTDGKDVEPDQVREFVAQAFESALPGLRAKCDEFLAALPKPQDGKDGEPGKSVTAADFLQLFEAEQGKWAVIFERRAQDVLQRAIDKMPIPKDGRDAVPLDGFEAELEEDGRTVVLRLAAGEFRKESRLVLPVIIDRGIFKDGDYLKGDVVTFGGTAWIATKDQPQGKPGDGESTDWRVFARRGRDGKDFRPEEPREPAVVRVS